MGCEGNVYLYDADSLEKQFGEDALKLVTGNVPTAYIHELSLGGQSHRILHFYYATCDFWKDWENRKDWYGDDAEKDEIERIFRWMYENAWLGEWEVWT